MDEIVDDIEAPENLSALVAATREALLRTHYTEGSLKVFERAWRDLEFEWPVDAAELFTREYGLAFLARRYGLALCEGQRPKVVLDQHRLRAIELLLDMQAYHQFATRRRRTAVTFTSPWATIFEAFVTFEKHVGRAGPYHEVPCRLSHEVCAVPPGNGGGGAANFGFARAHGVCAAHW